MTFVATRRSTSALYLSAMRYATLLPLLALGCASGRPGTPPAAATSSEPVYTADAKPPPVSVPIPVEAPEATTMRTGAERLAASGFAELRGMRVGLIANHTTRAGSRHVADLIRSADGVTLAALFGPEHGVRGDADAGERVANGRDPATGVPVFSLYGRHRAPTDSMLATVDVLVFDVQDVGARFYTYLSTMGLAMQSAARRGIPFVVLDRPNPLGGAYVGGFTLEPAQTSFVGQYTIPQAHGMTAGELARMIAGEALLPGLERLNLRVIEAEGWTRAQRWPAFGRAWVAPSPNIPAFETALVYAGTCLFEGTAASEGRGTRDPFRLLGAPWADADRLAADLNGRRLPGVRFEPARFTPASIAGMSSSPKLLGQPLQGVRIVVTDAGAVEPVALGVHTLDAFLRQSPGAATEAGRAAFFARADFFDKLAGTPRLREMMVAGATPEAVVAAWSADVRAFEARRAAYLLYP